MLKTFIWEPAPGRQISVHLLYFIEFLTVTLFFFSCFSQSATLLSGQEQPEPKSSNSDDSSSSEEEEEDQKLDLSSTIK